MENLKKLSHGKLLDTSKGLLPPLLLCVNKMGVLTPVISFPSITVCPDLIFIIWLQLKN